MHRPELPGERRFQARAAALLRSAANDLKRDDAAAERDLGLAPGEFAGYTSGRHAIGWDLLERAARVWPLSERDLLPARDDCPDGVLVHRAEDAERTSRVLDRGGAPYYEYRDTAMSRLASYRPEWIRMLRVVADADPENPLVCWNEGHLLYQFTYFVGPVNYYYRWNGVSRCAEMTTGDSVFGMPFAPHSFAARDPAEPAWILALTYGGTLTGGAQHELAALGAETAAAFAVEPGPGAAGTLLSSLLDARVMTPAALATGTGLDIERVEALVAGKAEPDPVELDALAGALRVSVRDLLPVRTETDGGVRIQRRADAPRWSYPDAERPSYRLAWLAGDASHPDTTALEVTVLATSPPAPLTTYQHQYVYVLGDAPVDLVWTHDGAEHEARLAAGDSAYVRPFIPLAFAAPDGGDPVVLVLRIGGTVSSAVRFALGAMADGGIGRYVAEDRLWYRPDGGRS